MSSLLLVVEQSGGSLKKVSYNALSFARQAAAQFGLDIHALVIGHGVADAAGALTNYGLAGVHVADDAALANYTTESYTQVIVQAAQAIGATLITGAASVMGKDVFPRVAGRLGAGMASDIVALEDGGVFKRPVWAGAILQRMQVNTDIKVVSLRATAFDAAEPVEGDATPVTSLDVALTDAVNKVTYVSLESTKSERPDLAEASVVVSGGRGMKDESGVALIEEFADLMGAAMGASRAACDAGMVPNDLQVGQTGKVVAPDLYFAVGISGAIQHLAGMKGSKVIVAINKDAEAPIFQLADYGLVADLFKAVPEFMEEYKKSRS